MPRMMAQACEDHRASSNHEPRIHISSVAHALNASRQNIERLMDIEQICNYCLSKPFATEDMPFGPEYVVFRIGGKIFCCLALVLGNVVQLKWNPDEFDEVIDKCSYVCQAWHWHKRHMIQFDLNESPIPNTVAKELIDRAYSYVRGKLPKKIQKEFED